MFSWPSNATVEFSLIKPNNQQRILGFFIRAKSRLVLFAALLAFLSFNCIPAMADSAPIAIGNGKVGIGTTSPANTLDVIGTSGGAAGIHIGDAAPSGASATIYNSGGMLYWSGTQISNGWLVPLVAKGTLSSGFTLDLNKVDTADITASLAIALPTSGFISGFENKCVLDFSLANGSTLTPPTGVKWSGGAAPTYYSTVSGIRNVLTFRTRDGGTTWEADLSMYGGVEMTFVQPTLSSNGTLGGSNFAVYATSIYSSSYDAYDAADNNSSTDFATAGIPYGFYYIWYNPKALKVSSISMTNRTSGENITGYTLYACNDNSSWLALVTGTNNITQAYASWSIAVPSANQGFYNYYKLYVSSSVGGSNIGFIQATLNATYMLAS